MADIVRFRQVFLHRAFVLAEGIVGGIARSDLATVAGGERKVRNGRPIDRRLDLPGVADMELRDLSACCMQSISFDSMRYPKVLLQAFGGEAYCVFEANEKV